MLISDVAMGGMIMFVFVIPVLLILLLAGLALRAILKKKRETIDPANENKLSDDEVKAALEAEIEEELDIAEEEEAFFAHDEDDEK